jgi:hypothetical protein
VCCRLVVRKNWAGHVAQLRLSGCATLSEEGDLAGYIAASATNPSPVQPASAIIAIKATICLVPALAALIAMLIFHQVPTHRQGVPGDPRRDGSPQTGRHQGAPREA